MKTLTVNELQQFLRNNNASVVLHPDGTIYGGPVDNPPVMHDPVALANVVRALRVPVLPLQRASDWPEINPNTEPVNAATAWGSQVGGSHYKGLAIQPMEYSMANKLDALQHTVVKYVTRFRDKGGVQDLLKARHAIDMLVEFEAKAGRGPVAANDNVPAAKHG